MTTYCKCLSVSCETHVDQVAVTIKTFQSPGLASVIMLMKVSCPFPSNPDLRDDYFDVAPISDLHGCFWFYPHFSNIESSEARYVATSLLHDNKVPCLQQHCLARVAQKKTVSLSFVSLVRRRHLCHSSLRRSSESLEVAERERVCYLDMYWARIICRELDKMGVFV